MTGREKGIAPVPMQPISFPLCNVIVVKVGRIQLRLMSCDVTLL